MRHIHYNSVPSLTIYLYYAYLKFQKSITVNIIITFKLQDCKETYEKEQKDFREWAKSLWTNAHCVRALRPKPTTEMVYEAEFKIRASEMAAFPKRYEMAALIPFDNNQKGCEIVFEKNLIKVSITMLNKINNTPTKNKTAPKLNNKVFAESCPV